MSRPMIRRYPAMLWLAIALVFMPVATTASAKPSSDAQRARPDFTLTILHANDLESSLLPVAVGDDIYGGADRFVTLLEQQRKRAVTRRPGPGQAGKRGVLTISAGDNFLPGPQLAASEDSGEAIYDATAFNAAEFDVSIFGNHDFDQNPDFLATWLADVDKTTTFVAGNLTFDDEPALLARVDDGTIVTRHVEKIRGERIGIIGLTTPDLPRLTSSRDVVVDPDLAEIANAQAEAYGRAGVDKVVLVSHLQDIDHEVALAGQLRGVDVIVGGGGHELLADNGDPLIPNGVTRYGSYPLTPTDADGGPLHLCRAARHHLRSAGRGAPRTRQALSAYPGCGAGTRRGRARPRRFKPGHHAR